MEREYEYIVNAAIESKFKPKHGEDVNETFQDEMKKDVPSLYEAMDKLVGEVMSYYQERVLLMEMLKAKDLQIAELEKEVEELKHELSLEDREVK
jgi:hypothetical protein